MPRIELMFPSRFLSAADLLVLPAKEATVTMDRVYQEQVRMRDGTNAMKWAVQLRGAKKLLILNKTNATTIAKLYGMESEGWPGKRITLYADRVSSFGTVVDAIRVRAIVPPAVAPKIATATEPATGPDDLASDYDGSLEPGDPGPESEAYAFAGAAESAAGRAV